MHDLAVALAHRHGLVAEDGQLWCWRCGQLGGRLPSLHCARCEAHAIEDAAHERQQAEREHPETRRWRLCFERMSEGKLDRAAAERLLAHAEALPTATLERRTELRTRFDRRFGAEPSRPFVRWGGRGFRPSGTEDE